MRIALFVDGNNVYGMEKNLGWRIDMKKMLDFASLDGNLVDAQYFIAKKDETTQNYLSILARFGYSIVQKQAKTDPVTGKVYKANMDIEMSSAIILGMPTYDKAVLVTGDGDFGCLVSILRNHGKMVSVINTESRTDNRFRTCLGMHFIEIIEHRSELEHIYKADEGTTTTEEMADFEIPDTSE